MITNNYLKKTIFCLICVSLLFLFSIHLQANNPTKSTTCTNNNLAENLYNAHIISLGPNCEAAGMKRSLNLNSPYYPFDFMTTQNFSVVCDLIENRFSGFFDRNNLKYERKIYVNTKYNGVRFNHEFNDTHPIEIYYEQESEKYQRRIARFYESLTSKEPVFFFRRSVEYKDALRFCNLIKKLSPQLNFLLIVINNGGNKKQENYTLPLVRKFNITPRLYPEWKTEEHLREWRTVFSALGLFPKNTPEKPKELLVERNIIIQWSEELFWNLNHE